MITYPIIYFYIVDRGNLGPPFDTLWIISVNLVITRERISKSQKSPKKLNFLAADHIWAVK